MVNKYIGVTIVTSLTLLLLFLAKDYPCLRGAGLAMADFEAFIFAVLIAFPCFIWAVIKLIRENKVGQVNGSNIVRVMSIFSIAGTVIYFLFTIALIEFTSQFPLRFICEQSYLSWLFKYPM